MASRTRAGVRIIWLAAGVVAVTAAYVAGWHYVADRVGAEAAATIAAVNSGGRRANCESMEVRGFPFRVGLFCQAVLYEDARAGIGLRARQLRSAAQVYSPTRVVAELDGPAVVEFPGLHALDVSWETMRASIRLDSPLPERLSLEVASLVAAAESREANPPPLVTVEAGEFHMRPNGAQVDVALRFRGLVAGEALAEGRDVSRLDGFADLALDALPVGGLRGSSGTMRDVVLTVGGDSDARLTGPFTVGADGLLDASLTLRLTRPDLLVERLALAFPDDAEWIKAAFSGIAMLGEGSELPVRVDAGEVRLGFLTFGSIPPLE